MGQSKLYDFFRTHGWKEPASQTDNAYTFAHQTSGLTLFEWLNRYPERLRAFNLGMAAQAMGSNWTTGIFPWRDTLSSLDSLDNTVLLVDVGGGRGQATRQIRDLCSGIKGRMILQDQEAAVSQGAPELVGIEPMSYDFFKPQPVKGETT